jgi:peptide/nickel transport system permease protein
MLRFLLSQALSVAITMAVVLSLVFVAMRALPGDAAAILGGLDTGQAQVAAMRAQLGLDRPLVVQFGAYWSDLLQGDLGRSIRERRPVVDVLIDRLPVTLALATFAFVLSLVIGLGLGLLAGRKRGTGSITARWPSRRSGSRCPSSGSASS